MSAKQSWQAGQAGAVFISIWSPAVLTVWGWTEMASAGKLVPLAGSFSGHEDRGETEIQVLRSLRMDTPLLTCGTGWDKAQGQAQFRNSKVPLQRRVCRRGKLATSVKCLNYR